MLFSIHLIIMHYFHHLKHEKCKLFSSTSVQYLNVKYNLYNRTFSDSQSLSASLWHVQLEEKMTVCHCKLSQPFFFLFSVFNPFLTFGPNLDCDPQRLHRSGTRKTKDKSPSPSPQTHLLEHARTHARPHAPNERICFIMTSLCIVQPTNTQSLIFPAKYLSLPMASLGARSKRSHN